jgi:N-acylneuraminate cytidylyltransferase
MKITAVIPIRKGSERVKDKNLKPFGDTTLLENKIQILKKVSKIDEIIVNTDSDVAIQIAKSLGVSFHRRDEYYASSKCTNSEFLEHLGKVTETDLFAYCPCTSPFISEITISKAITKFVSSPDNDSLATVNKVKEFLWLNDNPINYERSKQPNSQNLPDIFALNFGLNLIKRKDLIKHKNIVGTTPLFEIVDELEGIDIDTSFDFFLAEQVYNKLKNEPNFFTK